MVLATKYLDILLQVENRQLLKEKNKSAIKLLGECVISSVLSHHSKNLKWRTSVTVGYSSVLFSKQRIVHPRGMRWANPKGKASICLGFLLLYVCLFSTLSLPHENWASQEGGMFVSPEVLTLVRGFSFFLLSQAFLYLCLLATAILDPFSYSNYLTEILTW